MKKYWFVFPNSSPLANYVQPVLANTPQDAKTAMYRFYAAIGRYEISVCNPYVGKKSLPAMVVNGEEKNGTMIIKVECI